MIIENVGNFSVTKTFDCGQCFRFDPVPGEEECFEGVAFGNYARFRRTDGGLEITDGTDRLFWTHFLSLDEDYGTIDERIRTSLGSERDRAFMNSAVDHGAGIRILRQDPWETLISFIISQNNNIPRIKKIISALCKTYGERIGDGAAQSIGIRRSHICENAFPTPESLAAAGEAAIFDLRTGFRAKYICDAAEKVASGTLSLDKVAAAKSYDEAAEMLMSISGVGPKVAACTLLFGFARLDAFPIDVWIKRVISLRFPDGLDPAVFGRFAGLAQQYLFYCERYIGN